MPRPQGIGVLKGQMSLSALPGPPLTNEEQGTLASLILKRFGLPGAVEAWGRLWGSEITEEDFLRILPPDKREESKTQKVFGSNIEHLWAILAPTSDGRSPFYGVASLKLKRAEQEITTPLTSLAIAGVPKLIECAPNVARALNKTVYLVRFNISDEDFNEILPAPVDKPENDGL